LGEVLDLDRSALDRARISRDPRFLLSFGACVRLRHLAHNSRAFRQHHLAVRFHVLRGLCSDFAASGGPIEANLELLNVNGSFGLRHR
jgi:hypothetical protein